MTLGAESTVRGAERHATCGSKTNKERSRRPLCLTAIDVTLLDDRGPAGLPRGRAAADEVVVKGVRRVATFFGRPPRARSSKRDAISHLRCSNREVRAGSRAGPRRVGPAGASRL